MSWDTCLKSEVVSFSTGCGVETRPALKAYEESLVFVSLLGLRSTEAKLDATYTDARDSLSGIELVVTETRDTWLHIRKACKP